MHRQHGAAATARECHAAVIVGPSLFPKHLFVLMYFRLVKDSPRWRAARRCALRSLLPTVGPQTYPQRLWISGKCPVWQPLGVSFRERG
ncbi:Hypothetical protein I596_3050 [Dokdonella koreensis DS-123]|uniref:Uncharacterized protein n=1 Tax=Dokdonella koreensis DS-123 TaxID=1300342 RepID=A0A167H5Q9_9GAMM|nr:Hypothetical protein I596_3050 [Dokdonella koreensis DS-123]